MKIITLYLFFVWYIIHTFWPPSPDEDLSTRLKQAIEIDNVNKGGCGFTAYYIAQYLEKKGEICEIRQYGVTDHPRFHLMVYYRNTLIDASGVYGMTHAIGLLPYITVKPETLREQINKPELWNSKFNRADTTQLKQILGL